MLLALETATNVCSVALFGGNSVYEKRVERRGSHSEQLFLFIEELQEEHGFEIADLDALLVSEGPGSYTGLRISASAVKGLLFQTQVPLIGINTLASFAMQGVNDSATPQTIHSIIDARRVHVYHQEFKYQEDKLYSDDEVEVIPIEAFEDMVRADDIVVGTGLKRISDAVKEKATVFGPDEISAVSLIRLYQSGFEQFYHQEEPESFEPKYYTSNQVN